MGIFDKLFNQEDKEITSRDLKIALRGVERERRKKQMEIRKLSNKRNETIARLKGARKDNNREEVDFLYEDLQQIKMDQAYARRESKILNLEAIGLKRYVRGLERIEKTSNRGKVRDLMQRVQMSGLDEKLRGSADYDAGKLSPVDFMNLLPESKRNLVRTRLLDYVAGNQNHLDMYLVPSSAIMKKMEDTQLM